jgi:hypothetical protein
MIRIETITISPIATTAVPSMILADQQALLGKIRNPSSVGTELPSSSSPFEYKRKAVRANIICVYMKGT